MDKKIGALCESIVPLPGAVALPALPLDLDNSSARMSIQIKAGELAELIRRWGRDVYARARQAAPEAPADQPSAGQVDERAEVPATYMTPDQAFKWAWNTLKKDLGAERWNVGDEVQSWAFFKYGWDYKTQYEKQARASLTPTAPQAATTASASGLSDEQIVAALHAHGIDTYPSKYGFSALQVSATSVPNLRAVIDHCAALARAPLPATGKERR